jgi:hypothetical protein
VNLIEQKREELENADPNDDQLGSNLIRELEELDKEYEDLQVMIQELSVKINEEFQVPPMQMSDSKQQNGNMSFQHSLQDELF